MQKGTHEKRLDRLPLFGIYRILGVAMTILVEGSLAEH